MAARKKDEPEPLVIYVDGEQFALTAVTELDDGQGGKQKVQIPSFGWLDQLSFKEQLEVRKIARDLSGNAQGEPPDFAPMDLAPALLAVVGRRKDEKFSLDDALAFDWGKAQARPQKAAA